MRVGDFSVEVIAANGGAREIDSGHVLARPGQVYKLRLRNHGPLRAVADVSIDGNSVTAGGLVIDAWRTVDLERPIHETERGRFTVIAEGNEQVFGADGGRDNPNLGLIEARFRRELPRFQARELPHGPMDLPRPIIVPMPSPSSPPVTSPTRRMPDWLNRGIRGSQFDRGEFTSFLAESSPAVNEPEAPAQPAPTVLPFHDGAIERAAGTGLTGSSSQEFVGVHVGELETEATVIRLRLVIGTEEALTAPRPLPQSETSPARPAPRP